MSSRQLRKLQQQRELQQQLKLAQQQEEEESEEEPQQVQKPSLFANLAALEDDDESNDIEEDEEPEEEELSEPTPVATTKKPKKSKKKKKAKNKGKGKESNNAKVTEDKPNDGLDEIDLALKELKLKHPNTSNTTNAIEVDEKYERICILLGINSHHLKVANEMRSLFGRAAVESNEDPGGPTGRGARRRQQAQEIDLETALKGRHKPGKGLPELTLRRNIFIQGKDEWPKDSAGGLTMAVVDDQQVVDGTIEYKFVHNEQYRVVQKMFHSLVEMGDPQNLIGGLMRFPYHISFLLQVSKIAKNQGDHSLSSDLVERALFTFGRIALSSFGTKLTKGKARLDFARPENREFWLAGYHYIKSLMMKGTYRTAFEWAKLLLSLDPEDDPYCMRWMIPHLALRAHEFQWLLDFAAASKDHPVWANTINYAKPCFALAAQQLKDGVKCRSILSECMEQTPWLFNRLFKELDLDAPPSIWSFPEPPTASDTLFTETYILQAKDLWNTTESTALLMEIAHTIEKPDLSKAPVLLDEETMTLDIARYVYLDNRPELMAMVPSKLLHRINNSDSDPLPPYHSTRSYVAQREQLDNEEEDWDLGGGFNDPMAAIARLFPGFQDMLGGRGADDDSIDSEGEPVMPGAFGDGDGDGDADADAEFIAQFIPRGGDAAAAIDGARRGELQAGPALQLESRADAASLLQRIMFWRRPVEEEEDTDTDTDEGGGDGEMPGLIEGDLGEGEGEQGGNGNGNGNRRARVEDAEDEE